MDLQMERQSMVAYGAPLQATQTTTPEPTGTQVIISIKNCGVCHSDLHLQDGYFNLGGDEKLDVTAGRTLPFTLGHEIEGEVVALGPEARGVDLGARRAVYPWIGCGSCPTCETGDEHLCRTAHHLGITADGGFASHVVVPHPRYLLEYDNMDAALAGAYMCSGLTAFSALKKLPSDLAGSNIMLIGLGGVGMMGLQFAKSLFGVAPLAADIDPDKRQAGLDAGASAVYDPTDREARKVILKETGGLSAVVDFVGTESSLQFAQGILKKGGTVVISGLIGGRLEMPIAMFPLKPMSFAGTFVGSLKEAREMLDLVATGAVRSIPIERRCLDQANASLDDLRAHRVVGRIVLTPD